MSFAYKKQLGQHFLRYMPKEMLCPLDLIVEPTATLQIVEIGPGNGSVTIPLLQQLSSYTRGQITYTAVDLDPDALQELQQNVSHLPTKPNITFSTYQQDILTFDWKKLPKSDYLWIVGSLPYNVSKKIITKVPTWLQLTASTTKILPTRFILQLEVAQDYVSSGSKTDFLGNWLDLFSAQHSIKTVLPPGSFVPPPKVESAIIEIYWKQLSVEELQKNLAIGAFIKSCYQYPRKKMKQVIKLHKWNISSDLLSTISEKRAGELSVEDYLTLYPEVF